MDVLTSSQWMLLAKLYLNAEVYISTPKYDECLVQCEKLIGSSYELDPIYQNLFLADNDQSSEIIFPITFERCAHQNMGRDDFYYPSRNWRRYGSEHIRGSKWLGWYSNHPAIGGKISRKLGWNHCLKKMKAIQGDMPNSMYQVSTKVGIP